MKTLSFFLLPVILVTLLFSCKKNGSPDAAGSTLDKIVYSVPSSGADTVYYEYDSQNRLETITQTPYSIEPGSTYLFSYDASGKPMGYQYSNTLAGNIFSYAFRYDNNGRIVKSIGTPLAANLQVDDFAYAYDLQGRVVADTQLSQQNQAIIAYHAYAYDSNNDISEDDEFQIVNGSLAMAAVTKSSYDNKINPFINNHLLLFMAYGDPSMLCPNNLNFRQTNLANSPSAGISNTGSYAYSYYSNGFAWRQMQSTPGATNSGMVEFYFKAP
jgi:hypothetical protein